MSVLGYEGMNLSGLFGNKWIALFNTIPFRRKLAKLAPSLFATNIIVLAKIKK